MARPKKPKEELLVFPEAVKPLKQGDLNIDSLLLNAMGLVSGELDEIRQGAVLGKLPPEISKDLVAYTKLLYEIKNDSADALEEYTDEELMAFRDK